MTIAEQQIHGSSDQYRKIRDLSAKTQTVIRPDRQVRDSKKRGIAIERGKASLNDKSGKREKRRTSKLQRI